MPNKIKIKQIDGLIDELNFLHTGDATGIVTNQYSSYSQTTGAFSFQLGNTGCPVNLAKYDGQKISVSLYNNFSGYDQEISFHTGYYPLDSGFYTGNNKILSFSGQITGPDYQYYQKAEFVYNSNTGQSSQEWKLFSYNGMKI